MVRFVTIAIHHGDVAGSQQRLHSHLVGCGRAVRHEEDVVGTKGARGHLLGALDVACGLQKAVEAAGGRAAFGEEQVDTVKFAHVANPVGLKHRLSAGDGEGVESADRPAGVFFQIVEERCLVTGLHPLKDSEMKLQRFLDRIEDASHHVRRRVAGQLLHLAVGEQVDVEFRPDPLQCARETQSRHIRSFRLPQGIEDGAQHRSLVT